MCLSHPPYVSNTNYQSTYLIATQTETANTGSGRARCEVCTQMLRGKFLGERGRPPPLSPNRPQLLRHPSWLLKSTFQSSSGCLASRIRPKVTLSANGLFHCKAGLIGAGLVMWAWTCAPVGTLGTKTCQGHQGKRVASSTHAAGQLAPSGRHGHHQDVHSEESCCFSGSHSRLSSHHRMLKVMFLWNCPTIRKPAGF